MYPIICIMNPAAKELAKSLFGNIQFAIKNPITKWIKKSPKLIVILPY